MDTKKPRRNTKQRQLILEELKKLETHPSAADLYELVRLRMPNISLGTVYRNLELLAESGEIRKLSSGHPEARFDGRTDFHYHVTCAKCGRLEDVEGAQVDMTDLDLKDTKGFDIIGHQIQFVGVCPRCKSMGRTNPAKTLH